MCTPSLRLARLYILLYIRKIRYAVVLGLSRSLSSFLVSLSVLTSGVGLLNSNLRLITSVAAYFTVLIQLVYLILLFPLQKFETKGIYSCQTPLCLCIYIYVSIHKYLQCVMIIKYLIYNNSLYAYMLTFLSG